MGDSVHLGLTTNAKNASKHRDGGFNRSDTYTFVEVDSAFPQFEGDRLIVGSSLEGGKI